MPPGGWAGPGRAGGRPHTPPPPPPPPPPPGRAPPRPAGGRAGPPVGSEVVNQSPTTGERAGEGAVVEARHECVRSGRVDRRADGQPGEGQGVRQHGRSIAAPVPVHQVAVAVAAARRTTARRRLWARANQSRIARAFASPRTPMWRRPGLRAIALTHSAVAARSR